MTRTRRLALAGMLFGAVVVATAGPGCRTTGGPRTGELAPDFVLPDLDGNVQKLSNHRGRPVLVNLWATWCPPCLEELPNLIEAQEKYGPQGLQIVGLADETPAGDDPAQVLIKFMEEKGMNYPNALMTQEVELQLPETGVCSVTAGGEALALRLGLTRDQHEQLLHATAKHLGTSATASDAVLSAATELGIDHTDALQLAAYAAQMFDRPGAPGC